MFQKSEPTSYVLVSARQWDQVEGLGEAGSGGNRAALTALERGNMAAELRVDHGDLDVLHHHAADVADRLPGVVGDDHVGCELLAVVVDLPVEGHLQVDLAVAEGESLAHEGARQAAAARSRSVLQLWKKVMIS